MTNQTPHKVIEEGVAQFRSMRPVICSVSAVSDDAVDWLRTYSQKLVEVTRECERERLMPWLECSKDCISHRFEAGEPTKDGGYRVKVAGKWYQTRPVDESPKCDCGLAETLTKDTPAEDLPDNNK